MAVYSRTTMYYLRMSAGKQFEIFSGIFSYLLTKLLQSMPAYILSVNN